MSTVSDSDSVQSIRPEQINKENFTLSEDLSAKLATVSKQVHDGFGVAVVRGLHAAKFNDEEAVIAFVGICAHTCPLRATDSYANQTLSKFSVLCEVYRRLTKNRPHTRRNFP
jgi:hypothetical protein